MNYKEITSEIVLTKNSKSEYQQNNKFIGKGITDKRLYCKRTDKFFI